MPLHTIPLCDFKYAGDIYCSGSFKYDTTEKIVKSTPKLLRKDSIKNLQKEQLKDVLYKANEELNKKETRAIYAKLKEVDIKQNKELETDLKEIHIEDNKKLEADLKRIDIQYNKELKNKLKEINIKHNRHLKTDIKAANIKHYKELKRKDNLEFNKKSAVNLETKLKEMHIQNYKELKINNNMDINKNKFQLLYGYKSKNIDITFYKELKKYNDLQIDKNRTQLLYGYRFKNINVSSQNKWLYANRFKSIFKDFYKNMDVDTNLQFYKENIIKPVYKNNLVKLNYYSSNDKGLIRISNKRIIKPNINKLFYRDTLKTIGIYNGDFTLDRKAQKYIFKKKQVLINRNIRVDVFKITEKYLKRFAITNIYKELNKYLKNNPYININIESNKYIKDNPFINIYKELDKYLKDGNYKNIYKNKNTNYLEVIKRWWWLNPTDPVDKLVIPNKDFIYDNKLLNNLDYEYLRFNNNFPIPYGENSGIDYNIPPKGISIEIMLDLTNIITMIWHHNTQGWLNCTGKESIQFIMEILNDWYNMNTSRPNYDYIRVYRWIRWEAEKVYFLDTENGLQAIGILVANLIDYLKQHHFNIVPLWKNIKAMDIERNFNRITSNGDIIRNADKLKGKRHYCIETQNFEKKNIFGGK